MAHTLLKTKGFTWHHIQKPSEGEIEWVRQSHKVHELVISELTHPSARPKAERHDHYIYMVLHFPIFNTQERKTYQREIDFIITKKDLITVAYEPITHFEDFFRKCLDDKTCEDLYASKTPVHLLFYIIKEMFNFSLRQLDHIQTNINQIEEKISSGHERDVMEDLSIARRDIIDFRRALKPQHITLESLRDHGIELFGKEAEPYFLAIIGEYLKAWGLLENNKEALDALYDNNTTLLSIKQNEVMKMFTILAFVTFPLSLLVSILGLDSQHNPIRGSTYDFWIIIGIVFSLIIAMIVIFRRKNWI